MEDSRMILRFWTQVTERIVELINPNWEPREGSRFGYSKLKSLLVIGSQTSVCIRITVEFVKIHIAGSIPRVADSVGVGWVRNLHF